VNAEDLKAVLDGHRIWVSSGGMKGKRADLTGVDLTGVDLAHANLAHANLTGAILTGARLVCAILTGVDLTGVDLTCANLTCAILTHANLTGANLPAFQIPQEGELIVWKALELGIGKVRVPAGAKRTATPVGRKCRAASLEVLAIYERGTGAALEESPGWRGSQVYRVGHTVYPDSYNDDIRVECTHGLHFFLTRKEAEGW